MSIEKSIALIIPSQILVYQLLDRCPININHLTTIYFGSVGTAVGIDPLYGTFKPRFLRQIIQITRQPPLRGLFPWPSVRGTAVTHSGQSYFIGHLRPLDTQPNLVYDPLSDPFSKAPWFSSSVNVQLKLLKSPPLTCSITRRLSVSVVVTQGASGTLLPRL